MVIDRVSVYVLVGRVESWLLLCGYWYYRLCSSVVVSLYLVSISVVVGIVLIMLMWLLVV